MAKKLIERLEQGEVLALATKCERVTFWKGDRDCQNSPYVEISLIPEIDNEVEILLSSARTKNISELNKIFGTLKGRRILYVQGGESSWSQSGTDPLDMGHADTSTYSKIYTLRDMKPLPHSIPSNLQNNSPGFKWYGVYFK